MTLARVTKRDGREVPFDAAKIEAAVAKALAAVGEEDAALAREVAALVRLTLEARCADPAVPQPHIEQVQDLVEQALIEFGRARVAKAYILYRDRRARVRAALRVETRSDARLEPAAGSARSPELAGSPSSDAEPPELDLRAQSRVRVLESEGTSTWSKGRIVAALMNEADLERGLASEVAARVERRVFDAGWQRVSTALIRELVDNELVDLGLEAQLRRQGTVGWPRHDLRQLFATPSAAPAGALAAQVGGEVLRRFALEELVPAAIAERHLAGDLEILGLDAPHLHLAGAVPADLALASEPSVDASFAALGELARLLGCVSQSLVIEDPVRLLGPLVRAGRAGSSPVGTWLAAAAALARASGRRLDLGTPGPRAGGLLARLCEEFQGASDDPFAPRLFLDAAELTAFLADEPERREALEALVCAGRIVPTWSRAGERFAGPGTRRTPRERAALWCGTAVALNLPRLARRAGPWCEERMLEELRALVETACEAAAAVRSFQTRARAARAGEVRGRVMVALAPVGLREALQTLGDGEVRPDQGARLVGFLSDAARRLGAEKHLVAVPTAFFAERAGARFAALDRARPQGVQRLLFSDAGLDSGGALGSPLAPWGYRTGWRLAATSLPSPAEIEMLRTLPSGALYPVPAELGAYLDLSAVLRGDALATWRAFLASHQDDPVAWVAALGPAHEANAPLSLFDPPRTTLDPS